MNEIEPEEGPKIAGERKSPALSQDDVAAPAQQIGRGRQRSARASQPTDRGANVAELPAKSKRKTRRGKPNKRKHPYESGRKSQKVVKPEAPYNSNQFLIEDHGGIEELDENLRRPSCRTRDSSFSVDSDGEFYSSPDDEEQFLIKDFVDQYESVQAERLQALSKDELIQEYLLLEGKVEFLTKRLRKRGQLDPDSDLQKEVDRLRAENEALRRGNAALLSSKTCSSGSADSETDSDDSCSSSSSSSSNCSPHNSPKVDYAKTNGHSATTTGVETV